MALSQISFLLILLIIYHPNVNVAAFTRLLVFTKAPHTHRPDGQTRSHAQAQGIYSTRLSYKNSTTIKSDFYETYSVSQRLAQKFQNVDLIRTEEQIIRNGTADKVLELQDEQTLRSFLSNNPNTLLVVKFYAPRCQACKALSPLFRSLSNDPRFNGDNGVLPTGQKIVYARMDVRQNEPFFRGLGLESLPTVTVYHCGGGAIPTNWRHCQPCAPVRFKAFKEILSNIIAEGDMVKGEEVNAMMKYDVHMEEVMGVIAVASDASRLKNMWRGGVDAGF